MEEAPPTTFEQFFYETPNPVLRIDYEGVPLLINKAARELLLQEGWTEGSAIPATFKERSIGRPDCTKELMFDISCRNRQVYSFYCVCFPDKGYANLYGRDVTDARQLEQALRESEQRLRGTFENAAVGITHSDAEGHWTALNNKICEILGYQREELLGKRVQDVTHSDDLLSDWEKYQSMWSGKLHSYSMDKRYISRDGSVRWCNIQRSMQRDPEGKPLYAINIAQDITDRKQAEEVLKRHAALIDLSPDAIIVRSRNGTIKFWSEGASRLYGWKREEAIGRKTHDLLRTRFSEPFEHIVQKLSRGEHWTGELTHTTKDGRRVIVQSYWHENIIDGEAEILESNVDITERKRAEKALQQNRKALMESEVRVRRKLESVMSPEGDLTALELGDLIDAPALQQLMEDFYSVCEIPLGILDSNGRVLVGVGWQDICTRYHRVHPASCQLCMESDTQLTGGLAPGESRLYKCKNNLWDMATPIFVGGRYLGNIFIGQFFFQDETIDRELFRSQAQRYGFDEKEYLEALDRVPRLTRGRVAKGMNFFAKLAGMLSQLGFSNAKLARLLAERDRLSKSLQEKEERLRRFYESDLIGVMYWNMPGEITDANDKFLEMVGYEREDLRSGRVDLGRMTPEGYGDLDSFAIGELKSRGVDTPYEKEFTRKDGRRIPVLIGAAMLDDERFNGVAFVLDITDRKRLESELRAALTSAESAKALAEHANMAKDQFLATLSHELRTPLTPILAAVQLMQRSEGLSDKARNHIQIIRRNLELEIRLIDDLLDLTRIVRGKILLEKIPVNILDILDHVAQVCEPDLDARRLHFNIDAAASHRPIHADTSRIQQVFWNLVKNSIKFTPEGGCIGISAFEEGDNLIVEVRDSGIGIDPSVLPKIFNAFEQGDQHVTRQFGGLGLGLAISKRLVELHGGRISAHSGGIGQGAVFRVSLPIMTETERDAAASEGRDSDRTTREAGRPIKILLVEDHGDTAQTTRALLESLGHRVEIAGDVAEALQAANHEEFDLLISDLGLPDRSGLELMQEIRQSGRDLKGIALSGFGREDDVRRSKDAGFEEHLTKPVDLDTLEASMGRVISD